MLLAYNKTVSALDLAGYSVTLPASASAGVRSFRPRNVTNELRGLTNAQYIALQVLVTAGSVEFNWSDLEEYATVGLTVPSRISSARTLTAGIGLSGGGDLGADRAFALASVDVNGLSPLMTIRKAFVAGVAGTADDVTIYAANAPFGFRILDAEVLISAALAATTVQLRSAVANGGAALSDAFSSAAVGRQRDTGAALLGIAPTLAANDTLTLYRSDRSVAGEVIITLQRT